MTSREKILAEIKAAQPDAINLTRQTSDYQISTKDQFEKNLKTIGGGVRMVSSRSEIESFCSAHAVVRCVNALEQEGSPVQEYALKKAAELDKVHTVILEALLGVAENGAVYITEDAMINRLLPFVCEELVLFLDEKNIVVDMHEAYARIEARQDGYGVFIAGPSKTADIEQSLVIGAHGPLKLTVALLAEKHQVIEVQA